MVNWTNHKIVFLVWGRQSIRAHSISKNIGANLFLLSTSKIKHPLLFLKSLQILRRTKPSIIICQSPPITCSLTAIIYRYLFTGLNKPKILIDIHTGAITKPWSKNLSKLIMKYVSYNIVTNKQLQNYVSTYYGIETLVLEDPIPDFSDILLCHSKERGYSILDKASFRVAVISSFAYDEPFSAVLDAASELVDVQFYLTGDASKIDDKLNDIPNNVVMTGFLDYKEYLSLLHKVDVIMDLTSDDKTMLAGAFEALSLGKPLITSDWIPLRNYFKKGSVHIDNSPEEIKEAIKVVRDKKELLSKEMRELKEEKVSDWKGKISKFYYLL